MMGKKKLQVNCDVCDTRKMKEEDYSGYDQILINADVVFVNEKSKSILNRLPISLNNDKMIELEDNAETVVKSVNGSYEITGKTMAQERTILIVNGSLMIEPGTEEILKKYELIIVNGSARYPKSLDSFLGKMSVNGSVSTYPDDCVILDDEFMIDRYFPIRAREGSKYYASEVVIIKDKSADIAKLAGKNVSFVTKRLIVLECKLEDCVPMFDEQVDFVIVPEGMELVYGDCILNDEVLRKEGSRLFVYGDFEIDEEADADALCGRVEKLIVKGTVTLKESQVEAFRKIEAEYDELEIEKENRSISNQLKVRLDNYLFDNSPEGIEVRNVAKVVIAEEVLPETILKKLSVRNCARIVCSEDQESAVSIVAQNVAKIGEDSADENEAEASDTRMVNADSYMM